MHSLSDKEREDYFPVHIDLGKKESGMMPMPADSPKGKKGKPSTFYPSVYIDAMPGLEKLPKEGCMLVEFVRKRLTIEEGSDGEDKAGVTLELRRICLADDAGEDDGDDAPEDLDSALSQYGKKTAKKTEEADDDAGED